MMHLGLFGLALAAALLAFSDSRADDDKKGQAIQKAANFLQRRGEAQQAQPFGRARAGGPLIPAEAKDKLNLTADQKEKVAKLEKEFEEKNKEATDKTREAIQKAFQDRDAATRQKVRDLREAPEKLRTEYESKLTALLTDEQKKKFEEARQTARGRGGLGQNVRPFGRFQEQSLQSREVQEKLNLNDDQKAKLEQLQKEFEAKQLEVLNEEQKKQFEELKKQPARPNPRRPGGNR
jgi:Spy/CpxP family protein refolding chaperone